MSLLAGEPDGSLAAEARIRAVGPVSGPAGLMVRFNLDSCEGQPGETASYGAIPTEAPSFMPTASAAGGAGHMITRDYRVGTHTFGARCVASSGTATRTIWSDPGFELTITGPSRDTMLSRAAATVGMRVSVRSGDDDSGLHPCPVIPGAVWDSYIVARFDFGFTGDWILGQFPLGPDGEAVRGPPSFVVPANWTAGSRANVGGQCVDRDGPQFAYNTAPLSVVNPGPGTGGDCNYGAKIAGDTNCDGRVRVAVLGDSYIAGVGGVDKDEPYDWGTDVSENRCRRTSYSWGPLLAAKLGTEGADMLFAACNGATSKDVTSRGQEPRSAHGIHGGQPQTTTLSDWADAGAADIVLLSIGGNDVGFAGLASGCAAGPCLWWLDEGDVEQRAIDERYRLEETYDAVLDIVREHNPDAELWVAGYPSPVSGATCPEVGVGLPYLGRVPGAGIDRAEQVFLRDRFLTALNASVAWAAGRVGANVLELGDLANGHELCAREPSKPYFNGLDPGLQGDGPYAFSARTFHPNKPGYAHFASSLWTTYHSRFGQGSPAAAPPTVNVIPLLAGSVRIGPDANAIQDTASSDLLLRPGSEFHLVVADAPARRYHLVVRSLPVRLGTLDVAETGAAEATFTLPDSLGPGDHWLTLEDDRGVPLMNTIVRVAPPVGCEPAPGMLDVDGDDLADRCDPRGDDGPIADIDNDATDNGDDNCSTVPNATQDDVDEDGLGDACDPDQGEDPTAGYLTLPGPQPPCTGCQPPIPTEGPSPPSTPTGWVGPAPPVLPVNTTGVVGATDVRAGPEVPVAAVFRPAAVRVKARGRQRLGRSLAVDIHCPQRCSASLSATLTTITSRTKRRYALPRTRRTLRTRRPTSVHIPLPKRVRAAVRTALSRDGRATVTVKVQLSGIGGKQAKTRVVRLTPS